jgi:ABC-type sugar transport system permease subunit
VKQKETKHGRPDVTEAVDSLDARRLRASRVRFSGFRSRLRRPKRQEWIWYLFIAPNVLVFLAFNVYTWGYLILLAFQRWNIVGSKAFVGLRNFRELVSDPVLLTSFGNVAKYVGMFVPLVCLVSLGLALLANQRIRGMQVFRTVYYLPYVTSIAVLATIWRFLLVPRAGGPLNTLIALVGISPQNWLVSTRTALPSLVVMSTWSSMGYYMILWLAGLQSIPEELYDAAKVDGAGRLARFWYITLPMLKSISAFIVTISIIGAFQVFGMVYTLTGGGPIHATTTPVFYIWQLAFNNYRMGYAASTSLVLFVVILSVTLIQRRFVGWGEEMY